jgi:hypothetical protein
MTLVQLILVMRAIRAAAAPGRRYAAAAIR